MNREITPHDANKFWEYLEKEYPKISSQLSNRALVNGSIVSFKPARMSDEDYAEYERIMYTWQIQNGFWSEITIITSDNKELTILRDSIHSVQPSGDLCTLITVDDNMGGMTQLLVSENFITFKNRFYI
jgi:hypothetical protein